MKTLDFYIIRRILGSFFLGLSVLLIVLLLERSLRLIEIVTEQKASSFKVFELLFYLMPHYLGLAIPAALFLSILIAVRRLQEDSELNILQSAGLSLRYLYRPVFFIIVPATIIMLWLTSYAQPQSRYIYRLNLHNLSIDNPLAGLQSGHFLKINDNTTLYADQVQQADGLLQGVFISQKNANTEEQIVIGAQQAKLSQDPKTKEPILQLLNGNLVQDDKSENKVSKLSFDSYPWTLSNLMDEVYGPRGQDEREMVWSELLNGGITGITHDSTETKMKAELHSRFVQGLTLICLALWAVPLALIGSGRTGKASGLIIGGTLLILYEKIIGLGEAYVANGEIQTVTILWAPWIILGLSGLLFIHYKIPMTLKPIQVSKKATS